MARYLFIDQTSGHDPHARKSKPTGGILNSLTLIPEYLASHGHDVYVQSSYDKTEDVNGVHYVDRQTPVPKWDVAIFNRNVLPKEFLLYCKEIGAKVVWWLHDIVQLRYLEDDAFKYVDHVVALSDYCKETYCDFYSLNANKCSVIPNGVDKELFHPGPYNERNPNLYITASALVKGTMPLHSVFMNLKRVNPDVDFRIYSSQKLHGMNNSPSQEEFLQKMEMDGAHIYRPVSQEVLAHLLRKAHCLLMPNTYPEICSNLLLQAQASGCPVVTSNIGSAPEFIENRTTGLMTTKYYPHDYYSWIVEYTNLVFDLSNKELHKTISENASRDVKDWNEIGERWENVLKMVMAEPQVLQIHQEAVSIEKVVSVGE